MHFGLFGQVGCMGSVTYYIHLFSIQSSLGPMLVEDSTFRHKAA